ncbi:MAG: pyrrolo-quinoline quinone, partial [Myxococcales bacterium]|nr:pyrrolo-quinoline quinone [Myxococcales bacterium]
GATASTASVLTQHNDLARTGLNPNEKLLSPTNVDMSHFGKQFVQPVDGWIYAQPLVVPHVAIPNMGTHDVVYVATEHNSVYAFDAHTKQPPLWQVSFLSSGVTSVPSADTVESTILPEIGITGTPVIDVATSTLYVVAETKTTAGPTYAWHLHALDLATGAEKLGGPLVVAGRVPGMAPDAVGGMVTLSPRYGGQRAGLALSGGVLYVPFAGHGDRYKYWHGWVFGYDATTLAQKFVYCTTPDANEGAIWQSGAGIAVDADSNLYVETANGTFDGMMSGGRDLSESVLKLSAAGKLVDWFAPHDALALSSADADLGSAGPMLLPDQGGAHPHLVIASGKPGYLYVLDRDSMGHFNAAADSQIVQKISVRPNTTSDTNGIFATPVYFNGRVYVTAVGDSIKAFSLSAGTLSTAPVSQTTRTFSPQGHLAVSANGTTGGVVWVMVGGGFTPVLPIVLYAYDANDLTKELYSSSQAPAQRDVAGRSTKFLVPTVANGHVYVGTQTELDVYGEL